MSAIPTTPRTARSSRLTRSIRAHPLLAFFVLAFGLTWPYEIVDVLGSWGVLPLRIHLSGAGFLVILLTGYGPTFAALIVAATVQGRAGVRSLVSRIVRWRVGVQWYAVAIFLPALLFLGAAQMYGLFGRVPPASHSSLMTLLFVPLLLVVQGVFNGEEPGWRGFALPRLQGRYNALVASLILGVLWTLFHAPIFFTHGTSVFGGQSGESPFGFLVSTVALSVLFTWVFNNTRGSVLLTWLFHSAMNTWPGQIIPAAHSGPLYWILVGLVCLAAVIVVVVFGPEHLSRKPAADLARVGESGETTRG
jgi:membrane protease YdiL (CAAX protease family)